MKATEAVEMRVVPHRPYLVWLLGGGALVLVLLAATAGYVSGGAFDRERGERLREAEAEGLEATLRVEELEQALAAYELNDDVDTAVSEELRQTIRDLEGRISELNEEVRFYKRLMAPGELERGLQVSGFTLAGGTVRPDELSFNLLLTQATERRSWVKGRVHVDVLGQQEERDVVLSLTDLAELESYPLKFRFRYFQDFTGVLKLPEGFRPLSVVVTAVKDNGQNVQRTFDWRGLAG